jgi:hypothetical protein
MLAVTTAHHPGAILDGMRASRTVPIGMLVGAGVIVEGERA